MSDPTPETATATATASASTAATSSSSSAPIQSEDVSIEIADAALLHPSEHVPSDERKHEPPSSQVAEKTGIVGSTFPSSDADASAAASASPPPTTTTTKPAGPNPLVLILVLLLSPIIIIVFLLYLLLCFPFLLCDVCGGHASRHKRQPAIGSDTTTHSNPTYKQIEANTVGYIQSTRSQLWLYHRSWYPASVVARYASQPDALGTAEDVKGVVFIIHGIGEHISRGGYAQLAKTLTDLGLAVFAHDHQGHGKSTGEVCHVQHFQYFVDDCLQFMAEKNKFFPGAPRYIFGHSMGGLISLATTLQISACEQTIDLRGLVLSAPATFVDPELATPALVFAAKLLSFAAPKFSLDGISPTLISRSSAAVELYKTDPLIYRGGARARLANELLAMCDRVNGSLAQLKLPLLLLHATADRVVPIIASETIFEKAASQDKTFHKFEGLYHEMFEDPESDKFYAAISHWFSKHL